MPELPEVETVVRSLRPLLVGHTIRDMWYDWPRTLQSPSPDMFIARVRGQKVHAVTRRAKYIILHLDHDFLLIHLKMTGRLYVLDAGAAAPDDRWVHVRFQLDEGKQLCFSDSRKFGRVYLATQLDEIVNGLGPEPLEPDFTPEMFFQRLVSRDKALKSLLLDQTFVAGVGNIYADEALFRSGLHPLRRSHTLGRDEAYRLYEAVRDALNAGISHEGASINWYRKPDGTQGDSQNHFYVYGRDGQPCYTCQTTIAKMRVGQRGTHFCPQCQPAYKGSSS
jgi:formamidopyrimidine-DNA glycosylase